jgi:hypothetical protein
MLTIAKINFRYSDAEKKDGSLVTPQPFIIEIHHDDDDGIKKQSLMSDIRPFLRSISQLIMCQPIYTAMIPIDWIIKPGRKVHQFKYTMTKIHIVTDEILTKKLPTLKYIDNDSLNKDFVLGEYLTQTIDRHNKMLYLKLEKERKENHGIKVKVMNMLKSFNIDVNINHIKYHTVMVEFKKFDAKQLRHRNTHVKQLSVKMNHQISQRIIRNNMSKFKAISINLVLYHQIRFKHERRKYLFSKIVNIPLLIQSLKAFNCAKDRSSLIVIEQETIMFGSGISQFCQQQLIKAQKNEELKLGDVVKIQGKGDKTIFLVNDKVTVFSKNRLYKGSSRFKKQNVNHYNYSPNQRIRNQRNNVDEYKNKRKKHSNTENKSHNDNSNNVINFKDKPPDSEISLLREIAPLTAKYWRARFPLNPMRRTGFYHHIIRVCKAIKLCMNQSNITDLIESACWTTYYSCIKICRNVLYNFL